MPTPCGLQEHILEDRRESRIGNNTDGTRAGVLHNAPGVKPRVRERVCCFAIVTARPLAAAAARDAELR